MRWVMLKKNDGNLWVMLKKLWNKKQAIVLKSVLWNNLYHLEFFEAFVLPKFYILKQKFTENAGNRQKF